MAMVARVALGRTNVQRHCHTKTLKEKTERESRCWKSLAGYAVWLKTVLTFQLATCVHPFTPTLFASVAPFWGFSSPTLSGSGEAAVNWPTWVVSGGERTGILREKASWFQGGFLSELDNQKMDNRSLDFWALTKWGYPGQEAIYRTRGSPPIHNDLTEVSETWQQELQRWLPVIYFCPKGEKTQLPPSICLAISVDMLDSSSPAKMLWPLNQASWFIVGYVTTDWCSDSLAAIVLLFHIITDVIKTTNGWYYLQIEMNE